MTADGDEPLLTARRYLDAGGFDGSMTQSVIMVYDRGLVDRVRRRRRFDIRRRSTEGSRFPFPIARRAGIDVVASGPGSPAAAVTLELVAALGAERVITVGSAAALTPISIGTQLVVTTSQRDGTPLGYPSAANTPDAELSQWLRSTIGLREVTTLTTDVPFLQTPAAIAAARRRAAVLEMECATVFEVAASIGLPVASIVVVSDRYRESQWSAGDRATVQTVLEATLETTREALTVR